MAKRTKGERTRFEGVDIIDTADEGLGIGRCADGRIILVLHAVPGDVMDVEVVDKRKGMFVTRATALHTPSAERTEPFCDHFGLCGGCKWQQMTYAAQLHFKEKKVRDAIRRIGGFDEGLVQPIIGAGSDRFYRNKLEYTASDRRWLTTEELAGETLPHRDGIGFHLPGAFDKVLDIGRCHLQADPSNAIRLAVKDYCHAQGWSFANVKTKTGFLRNIIIRNNIAGEFMVTLVAGQEAPERLAQLCDMLTGRFREIISIYGCVNPKVNDSIHDLRMVHLYGETHLVETLGHVRFRIGPKSFFQTNSLQALALYAKARELAALQPDDHVYDLYCGVGSLGLYMASGCKHVVGIEQIPEAIEDAHLNAALNGITHASFETGQVELLLDPAFIARHGRPDVVITDPPRAGMHPDVIRHLITAAPARIVYVSCNPATQARDLALLREAYRLVTVLPVDMFPHTHHIESIALLHRA
jgi:23S rRNA (uracil1939-C5)-methyltransferase